MLSTFRQPAKEFVERAIQTDPLPSESPPSLPVMEHGTGSLVIEDPDASPAHSAHSEVDRAYTHEQTETSFESISSSADQSMTTTTREYKMQLPSNRPTALLHRQPSSRIVSLPEATPKFHAKTVLEKKTTRIVSMPVSTSQDASSDSLVITDSSGSFICDEEPSRVRVCSQATDAPCTPSEPSSPDSVVIIANNSNPLSSDFLRRDACEETPPDSDSDDEGWVSWTKSPPRPIPALHGPLSLPYARCPSGAEGTIIEEPESLPRVIWGLESDSVSSSRVSSKPFNNPHAASQKPAGQSSGDSQLVKPRQPHVPPNIQTSHVKTSQPSVQVHLNTSIPRQAPSQPPDFMLKHSEPIDLGRLVPDIPQASQHATSDWQPFSLFPTQLPTPELVNDLSPDLQEMLFAQQRYKNSSLSPSFSGSIDIRTLMNSGITPSSSSSSLDSLQSSRSPIVLEDLASHCYPYPQNAHLSNSALDIAQKYRQQQLHQQGLLPTPPNSTSPIWSSAFSPYPDGILSPELLAAAGLTQLHPHRHSQPVLSRMDQSHQLLSSHGALVNSGLTARKAALGSLAPPAHIGALGAHGQLPPRLAAEYARRRNLPEESSLFLDAQLHALSTHDRASSPTVPKAPPNTPYGASTSPRNVRRLDPAAQQSLLNVPSSASHHNAAQSLGLSHVRSVPLSKLVQRRLSTVPEEDHSFATDRGRTPPAVSQGSSAGLHLFLSPSSRPTVNAATVDSLGDALRARCGADGMGEAARDTTVAGVLGRSSGPGGHGDGSLAKEASRRQGSNVNIDGGRRGESGRGRGQKKGGRGRKGRAPGASMPGAERVDGGLVVKS